MKLSVSIEKYEIISDILAQTIESGSNLLDTEEFRDFCNNSVDQFRLLMDYDERAFDQMLNSNIGCQLLMEWLLFLAPLAPTIGQLQKDPALPESLSFVQFLNTSGADFVDNFKLVISEKDQATLQVSINTICRQLIEGLSLSRLSVFCVEQQLMNCLSVKDKITGEIHYLYDPELLELTPNSEIFIGRIIQASEAKLLLSVYCVLPDGKSQNEIVNSCKKWNELMLSEDDFSISDMQVNLLEALVHYLV